MVRVKKNYKQIYDTVHGSIQISDLACKIIDTNEFQRLRFLRQLGNCHYVFPSATHTRFEHSIGTYHLAGKMLECLKMNSSKEHITECIKNITFLQGYFDEVYDNKNIELDEFICELIKIAALCHDIGHGPFSHVFDDTFIVLRQNENIHKLDYHEERSCAIIENIIKKDPILKDTITDDEIAFIKNLINPSRESIGFIYQIVSNNFNSIDVDKFDYLARDSKMLGLTFSINQNMLIQEAAVIDDKICFLEQMYHEIYSIFATRYRMHKQVYAHKAVIGIQYMICEIMKLIDPIIKIYESIFDINTFCDLTDDYIFFSVKNLYKNIGNFTDVEQELIRRAYAMYERIITRDLYKFVTTFVSKDPLEPDIYNAIDSLKPAEKEKIIIHKSKIGLVSGSKTNPINNLYFYKNKDPTKCYKIEKEEKTQLISNTYQEYIYMIFLTDKSEHALEKKIQKLYNRCFNS